MGGGMIRAEGEQYAGARHVNPDAGDHLISAHPEEMAAAERATRRSYALFPYYGLRYGARGRRFSLSDSGWITMLCDLLPDTAKREIRWLGGVLSSRGMPQWMLECHLEILHEELTGAMPDQSLRYERLLTCAEELRQIRQSHVPEDTFRALAAAFDERTRGMEGPLRNVGGMLVSAAADETAGIANAVPTLEAWMCDPERFPAPWIDAVRATIAEARAAAR